MKRSNTVPKTAATPTTASTTMIATRFFRDAGTGASFEKGAQVNADAGILANYAAAGLVSAPDAETPAADAA